MQSWYKSYDSLYHGVSIPEERIKLMLRLVCTLKPQSMLDVGCGDGSLTVRFREELKVPFVAGLELSEDGAMMARKRDVNVHVVDFNSEGFPFLSDTFDFVLCSEVIEHLFDPDHLVQEISRTLKVGGILLLTTPNISSWYDRFALLLGYQPISISTSLKHPATGRLFRIESEAGREHIRFFTQRALKETMARYGLRPIRVAGWMKAPPAGTPAMGLVKVLNSVFSLVSGLCTTSIIVCKKEKPLT